MKITQTLLVTLVAGLLISTLGVSSAQETTAQPKTQTPEAKQENQKKKQQARKSTFLDALDVSVKDLTADQKTKIDLLQTAATAAHKKVDAAVGLTSKMNKKRQEVFNGLPANTSYKERNEKACKEAGFNQAQIDSLKDRSDAYRSFRYESMRILTAEQQKKMPKWYQNDFKASVEMAAKKAKEKADKKAAKAKTESDK